MSKISDELRAAANMLFLSGSNGYNVLMDLAERIDAEMVELPKDADGKPIHLGDTVYDLIGNEHTVFSLYLYEKAPTIDKTSPMWTVSFGFGTQIAPRDLTHKRPDSLERIADELLAWCDGADVDGDACGKPRDLADRIRKLAKEDK